MEAARASAGRDEGARVEVVAPKMNTTVPARIRSVQSDSQRENRSVQSVNTTVPAVNTTEVNTTNEWDAAPAVKAADTGKRIEIRYNKRKGKEDYYYWVYRWAAEVDGKPVKRSSGTYVRNYEYGGKLETIGDKERLGRYEARK